MNLSVPNETIPGTVLNKEEMGNVSGMEFLDKIFYISDGIMLSQIREICGIGSSVLQNWVKRGWLPKPDNKRYTKDHLARILIINMLKKNTQLERIDFLLRYINGNLDDRSDDIIPESVLYDYISRIIDATEKRDSVIQLEATPLRTTIRKQITDYQEPSAGAKERLEKALTIIVLSYFSALITGYTEVLFDQLS